MKTMKKTKGPRDQGTKGPLTLRGLRLICLRCLDWRGRAQARRLAARFDPFALRHVDFPAFKPFEKHLR
jgi:hypothetical protein